MLLNADIFKFIKSVNEKIFDFLYFIQFAGSVYIGGYQMKD